MTYEEFNRRLLSEIAAQLMMWPPALRALACPSCGKPYGISGGETRSVVCCGREATPEAAVIDEKCYAPSADQFVDGPAIVDGGKDADSYKLNPGGQRS
jgi:hypothetical protein